MKKTKKLITSLISDESGNVSSKRCMGILACIVLFTIAIITVFFPLHTPNENIINNIVFIAFGCLGLTSLDKFSKPK